MELTGRTLHNLRIGELLAEGGMGKVFRGFDLRLKRPVAIKALRRPMRADPVGRARFIREARLLSRLDHPGICRVYDLVEHPEADLLVLELIQGRTLFDALEAGDLDDAQKLHVAESVADAMAAAHRQLILHRDLKPQNIMLTDAGEVKVLDFGIARPLREGPAAVVLDDETDTDPEDAPRDPGDHVSPPKPRGDAVLREADTLQVGNLDPGATAPAELDDGPTAVPEDIGSPVVDPGGMDPGDRDPGGRDPGGDDTEVTAVAGQPVSLLDTPTQDPEETFLTRQWTTIGTISYMSPEQARGSELTVASDVYSLGVILQELFTGERAYPRMPYLELLRFVAKAETLPMEGLDPDLTTLIQDLEHADPAQRPSAPEIASRLRWIRGKPERAQKRKRRAFRVAMLVAVILMALGLVVHSRLQARRDAEMAQRFAQEASAAEWRMRAEHLAPAHDVRPAREGVRERMELLEEQMRDLGPVGQGAGHYALGRAALAVGESAAARRHLERAWDGGYRQPEVATHLGLAMFDTYQRELAKAHRIDDDARRDRRLTEIHVDLRDRALDLLERAEPAATSPTAARESSSATAGAPGDGPSRYSLAIAAFYRGRYDEALAEAEAAAEGSDWFYEPHLLAARVHQALAFEAETRSDHEAVLDAFDRADHHAQRAAEVGRSDPEVHALACELAAGRIDYEARNQKGDAQGTYGRGVAHCRTALTLDPGHTRSLRLLGGLSFRLAETLGLEEDPRPRLAEAAAHVRGALEIDPTDAEAWRTLGNTFSVRADWETWRGLDPDQALDEMLAAYQRFAQLAPRDPWAQNALGNAHSMRAEQQAEQGQDPTAAADLAIDAYRAAADLAPEAPFALGNLALTYASLARWRFYEGLPLEGTVNEGRAVLDELRRRNPDSSPAMLVDLDLSVLTARRALALGEDPAPPLGRAIAVAETARGSAATFHLYFVMAEAEAHLTWAEHLGPSTPEGAAYLERALGGIHEATTADP
ncbi:MAG: protein kinase, partial [Acidobacteriota bacterium]